MAIGKEAATTATTTAIAMALPAHRTMPNPIMTGFGAFRAPCTVVLPVFAMYCGTQDCREDSPALPMLSDRSRQPGGSCGMAGPAPWPWATTRTARYSAPARRAR